MRSDEENIIIECTSMSTVKRDYNILAVYQSCFVLHVHNFCVKILGLQLHVWYFTDDFFQLFDEPTANVQPVPVVYQRMSRPVKIF